MRFDLRVANIGHVRNRQLASPWVADIGHVRNRQRRVAMGRRHRQNEPTVLEGPGGRRGLPT
jgi:hypothetical protein